MKQAERRGGLWGLLKGVVAGLFGPIERSNR